MQKNRNRCDKDRMIVLETWTVTPSPICPNLVHKWFFRYFYLITFPFKLFTKKYPFDFLDIHQ